MTPKERLLAAISHEKPDRVPISPRMYLWAGEKYGNFDWRKQLELSKLFGTDPFVGVKYDLPNYPMSPFAGNYGDLRDVSVKIEVKNLGEANKVSRIFETPAGILSDQVLMPHPRSSYGLAPTPINQEPLIKDITDVEKLSFLLPPPENHIGTDLRSIIESIGDQGLLEVQPTMTPSLLSNMLGSAEMMLMYYDDRELLDTVINLFADYSARQIEAVLKQGVPVIFASWHNLGVSSGWSPSFFRDVVKPLIKREVELVHAYGAYYTYFDNGRVRAILPDIAEAGVDIISTLCPAPLGDIDLAEVKAAFGDRLCLHGNVDAIGILQRGTPDEVREAVKTAISIGSPGGGFILGNSDCFFQETPDENIQAFFEAAHRYG